eukprot:420779-Alexandrium_andersonii.AAC.1
MPVSVARQGRRRLLLPRALPWRARTSDREAIADLRRRFAWLSSRFGVRAPEGRLHSLPVRGPPTPAEPGELWPRRPAAAVSRDRVPESDEGEAPAAGADGDDP